ncbi:helix-turn-helix transcriptional regulator [Glycomyces scopariae]
MTVERFPSPPVDGQSHVERLPVPALRGLVSSVWVQQVGRGAAPYAHRRIPNGSMELTYMIGSAPRVAGPLAAPRVEVLVPGTVVVGMRFRPGAFASLVRMPASELTGLALDTEELWGRSASALGEAVGGAPSPEAALAAMQRDVLDRAGAAPPPDALVSAMVRDLGVWGATGVAPLRSTLHLSESQLRRRCHAAVGLAPKTLHRMLRFQGFLALVQQAIAQGRAPDGDGLALLALRVGYADQSHLTRECVRLTGLPPRAFLVETERTCACGHEHAASFTSALRGEARGPA